MEETKKVAGSIDHGSQVCRRPVRPVVVVDRLVQQPDFAIVFRDDLGATSFQLSNLLLLSRVLLRLRRIRCHSEQFRVPPFRRIQECGEVVGPVAAVHDRSPQPLGDVRGVRLQRST